MQKRVRKATATYHKAPLVGFCAFLLLFAHRALGEDIANLISGVTTGTLKTNTPCIVQFWSAKFYSPASVFPKTYRVQYYADGSSQTLARGVLSERLEMENLTTYTIYVLPNAGKKITKPLAATAWEETWNETSPTLSTTSYWKRLSPQASGYPYLIIVTAKDDPSLFPLRNIGIFISAEATVPVTGVTSATLRIMGR
jgi:hypothetical protein